VDQDFMHLYVAKNYIAPGAQYVCAGADITIPLAQHSCSFAFCSDAFTLFLNQASCMRELKRVISEDGVILLSPVRNGLVKKDLYKSVVPSLPPEAFSELAGDLPHRIISNDAVMNRYLKKQGPALAWQTPLAQLHGDQWLSLVATRRNELFRDNPAFNEWPHIEGSRLGINPIYKRSQGKDDSGNVALSRVSPSMWYQQENATADGQFPTPSATVSSKTMTDIQEGRITPEVDKLIAQGVVLGFPGIEWGDVDVSKGAAGPHRSKKAAARMLVGQTLLASIREFL
jgi:hypothetical protein